MMSLLHPPVFEAATPSGNLVRLTSPTGPVMEIFVLEEDIIRVRVLPDGRAHGPRTWAIAPGLEDVALEGRDRLDLIGYTLPPFSARADADHLHIETSQIRLDVALRGGYCSWALRSSGQWQTVLQDRATQAYNFGWWDERVYHYVRREPGEMYLGLGERAGSLDRAGQRYQMVNIDAMGYSAKHTDPLYKHIPFYLTWQRAASLGFGLFYDTLADCTFDMGRELDNYHGHYRHFIAEHGDLDYYFIASPATPLAAVRRFTWLTGRPALMPKWGLGYSGSTMSYTDASNAQEQMGEFIARCREHDILCDSFHLSSGYTSIGPKRYVFNWNHDKFPDIDGFVQSYLDAGVRLCANIKPCLLRDHPEFEQTARDGLMIRTRDGEPAWVQFWDEVGAYLDFTNPNTIAWWRAHVTDALLRYGIASTWNDNNEFEIWSKDAIAHGFGEPFPAHQAKVLQTMLMMRASRDAQRAHAPNLRPFLVSRSGGVGMHRYVQTWSGDNYTSWETLRYNLKMGLGLALSGVSNIGHDIGGFSGPAPDADLFVRWVQFGILMPRFSIHSWNDDGTVNEPWMHAEATHCVSGLIKLRYRLLPYLYHLLWESSQRYEPVLRPTFAEFPQDAQCYEDGDDLMLGAALLFAPVVEAAQTERTVWLPEGARWISFWSGAAWDGGQRVTLPAPWDQPVMLIREGSVVPLNVAELHFAQPADSRGFMIAPHQGTGVAQGECFEDDGESEAWRSGEYGTWNVSAAGDALSLNVSVNWTASAAHWKRPFDSVEIFVPASDARRVIALNATIRDETQHAGWKRLVLDLTTTAT
jgi:alpha-glucosidase